MGSCGDAAGHMRMNLRIRAPAGRDDSPRPHPRALEWGLPSSTGLRLTSLEAGRKQTSLLLCGPAAALAPLVGAVVAFEPLTKPRSRASITYRNQEPREGGERRWPTQPTRAWTSKSVRLRVGTVPLVAQSSCDEVVVARSVKQQPDRPTTPPTGNPGTYCGPMVVGFRLVAEAVLSLRLLLPSPERQIRIRTRRGTKAGTRPPANGRVLLLASMNEGPLSL
jgi:hypothetical protein